MASVKSDFAKLLQSSVISQALLMIVAVCGAIYVQVSTGHVPDWLLGIVALVVGFYFGHGNKHAANRVNDAVREAMLMTPPSVRKVIKDIESGHSETI